MTEVSGYSLSAEVHEDKPYELRDSHYPCGHQTGSLLSKELPGGREVDMNKCENLSDREQKSLLPPCIWDSQDEGSVFVQTDEWWGKGDLGNSVLYSCLS